MLRHQIDSFGLGAVQLDVPFIKPVIDVLQILTAEHLPTVLCGTGDRPQDPDHNLTETIFYVCISPATGCIGGGLPGYHLHPL